MYSLCKKQTRKKIGIMIKLVLLAAASVFYFSNPTTILSAWYNTNSSNPYEAVVGVAVPTLPTPPNPGTPTEGTTTTANPVTSAHVATIAPNTGEVVHATVTPISTTTTDGAVNLSTNTGTSSNEGNPLAHISNTANTPGTTATNNSTTPPTNTVANNPTITNGGNNPTSKTSNTPNTNVQEPPRFDVIISINNPQQRRFSLKLKLVNPTNQTYSDASARVTLPAGIEVLQEMQFKKSTREATKGTNSIWCKFDPVAAHSEQSCECMLIADRDGKFTLKIGTRLDSKTKGKVSEEVVELRAGN